MNICPQCSQALGEDVSLCPVCGTWIDRTRTAVGDYHVEKFVHEGHGAIGYKARRADADAAVFLRVFKPESGITPETAARLRLELETLRKMPPERFVRHLDLCRSPEGFWYRVSEWLEAESWADVCASGSLRSASRAAALFQEIAAGIAELHAMGCAIPHLTTDDLIAVRGADGAVAVKIDYKVSRFINPALPSPRPQLAALLAAHPDLRASRPLDQRTDVWSMGRVFAMLFTGQDEAPKALEKLEASSAPERMKTLLRQMLEEDPELRPSAVEVAGALRAIATEADEPPKASRRGWQASLALGLVLLLAVLGVAALWLQARYGIFSRDSSTILGRYAQRHRGSVAFVATVYEAVVDGKTLAVAGSEGTAFLVTADGYLLTNRHVACPWLEDAEVDKLAAMVEATGRELRLRYRILLWFDGRTALRRERKNLKPKTIDDLVGDRYFEENAYSSGRPPAVKIAGILPAPRTLREQLRSPLEDDVALLKIDRAPHGAVPLPLPGERRARPLTPVLAMGFPMGSTQNLGQEVEASATLGNVRRSFENVHQISASIHHGNSGGPVIDIDGQLLGIASAMAVSSGEGSGSSDFGMVLPVERALPLLEAVRRGERRWDGLPDYAMGSLRRKVAEAAENGDWAAAIQLTADHRQENSDPKLLELAALLEYGNGNAKGARDLLNQAISETPEDQYLRFLRFVAGWKESRGQSAPELDIRNATWDSPAEFYRFIARVLAGQESGPEVGRQWEDGGERALLGWALGQREWAAGRVDQAARLFREAASEAGQDTPERILLLADLRACGQGRALPLAKAPRSEQLKRIARSRKTRALLAGILGKKPPEEQLAALEELVALDPEDATTLLNVAFRHAGLGNWGAAAGRLKTYAARPHRVCANSMAAALLRAQLLGVEGHMDESRRALEEISRRADWPWYPAIARDLLGTGPADSGASRPPAELVTLCAARGVWAEAHHDTPLAMRCYRAALDSYLSSWAEYQLAETRIQQLRK